MKIPETRARKAAIRVAVLFRTRLGADVFGAALTGAGFDVALSTSDWSSLLNTDVPVDIAVLDQYLGDGMMLGRRIRQLGERKIGAVVIGSAASVEQREAVLHAGALAFVAFTESLDDLATSVMLVASDPDLYRPDGALPLIEPGLGRREEHALMLYASGRTMREVAHDMHTTEETVKSYIKRARRKYREAGIDLGTRMLLRGHAVRHGWVS